MTGNRALDEMTRAAREWLAGRSPEDIAQKTGIEWSAARSEFSVESFGRAVVISWPGCETTPPEAGWHGLVLLHLMNISDGAEPAGRMKKMTDLKDGLIRGGGFDREFEESVRTRLGAVPPDKLRAVCAEMGAELVSASADISAVFHFAPRFPVTMNIWLPDPEDDIPASGRLLFDESADRCLTIEDIYAVGTYLRDELEARCLGRARAWGVA